jgi:hypothetical protein
MALRDADAAPAQATTKSPVVEIIEVTRVKYLIAARRGRPELTTPIP